MNIIGKTMKAGKVVKQAMKTQAALRKMKAVLESEEFSACDDTGAVEVVVLGNHRITAIRVTGFVDQMEVAIQQAANAAIDKADTEAKSRTKAITGGTALDAFDLSA